LMNKILNILKIKIEKIYFFIRNKFIIKYNLY